MKRKTAKLPSVPATFTVTHPIYGERRHFKSWIELCDKTIDIATRYIEERMISLITALADEMMDTAVEDGPKETH